MSELIINKHSEKYAFIQKPNSTNSFFSGSVYTKHTVICSEISVPVATTFNFITRSNVHFNQLMEFYFH